MAVCYRYANAVKCANCGWNMKTVKRLSWFKFRANELPTAEREILASWLPTDSVLDNLPVCRECMHILERLVDAPRPVARQLGHSCVCAACGDSIARGRRSQPVDLTRAEQRFIFTECLQPQLQLLDKVCQACVRRGQRAIEMRQHKEKPVMVQESEIDPDDSLATEVDSDGTKVLRNKTVTVELNASTTVTSFPLDGYLNVRGKKGGVCVTCAAAGVRRLNLPTRQKLLLRHKIYVSTSAKVCEKHRVADTWPKNEDASQNNFTSEEIADVIFLLKGIWPVDFGKVENLHHHILNRWIGSTLEAFEELYQQKPVLQENPNGRFALAVWLASKHTGECATVLASLTQRPRGLITAAIKLANECTQPQ